jgi:predicted transglutaminase-like cysteine proteinase
MFCFKKLLTILAVTSLTACASEDLSSLQAVQTPSHAIASESRNPLLVDISAVHAAPAKPPSGYIGFCKRFPDQCAVPKNAPAQVKLTDDVWNMLEEVNAAYNTAIEPEDDSVHYGTKEYWTIPTDGRGDCEDYVVSKRKALMQLGLPMPALRIAVVFTRHFVRHAVLTVATDKGNYVLDNLNPDIVSWDQTGYTFVERQDPASSSGWVSLE